MATSGVNCPLPLPVPTFSRPEPLSTQPRRSSSTRYPPSPSTMPCAAICSSMLSVCLIRVICSASLLLRKDDGRGSHQTGINSQCCGDDRQPTTVIREDVFAATPLECLPIQAARCP